MVGDWKIIMNEESRNHRSPPSSPPTYGRSCWAQPVDGLNRHMEGDQPSSVTRDCWGRNWCRSYLVEVPLLFVQGCAGSVCPLHVEHEVLNLILEPLLGLLKGGTFGVHSFHVLLSSLQTLGQFLPGRLRMVVERRKPNRELWTVTMLKSVGNFILKISFIQKNIDELLLWTRCWVHSSE